MRASAFGDSSITRIICPSMGLPPWESTMSLATRTGADAGGYSLSGEAKEAALSRFALPENRKAALDMIRKLNESRDSNENAL